LLHFSSILQWRFLFSFSCPHSNHKHISLFWEHWCEHNTFLPYAGTGEILLNTCSPFAGTQTWHNTRNLWKDNEDMRTVGSCLRLCNSRQHKLVEFLFLLSTVYLQENLSSSLGWVCIHLNLTATCKVYYLNKNRMNRGTVLNLNEYLYNFFRIMLPKQILHYNVLIFTKHQKGTRVYTSFSKLSSMKGINNIAAQFLLIFKF
jgi:hypothetical protein